MYGRRRHLALVSPTMRPLCLVSLCFIGAVMAQTCENSGIVNATSNDCECLTGFGGTNCSQPACGGTIFQGRDRALVSTSSNGFANLTAAACKCEGGWTGLGCNVCQTPNACASGYSSVSGSSTPSVMDGVQNTTMVCNSTPRVWAAGQMSCAVNVRAFHPSLHAHRIISI